MGSFVWLHLVGVALQNIVPVPKHLVVMAHHRLVADHILDKVHYALSAIGAWWRLTRFLKLVNAVLICDSGSTTAPDIEHND